MPQIYIGYDNGVSGAACAISDHDGSVISYTPMPVKRGRNANEVDVRALWEWLSVTTAERPHDALHVIEEPGGSKSASAAKSMAGSFHALRAMVELKSLPWERITPQKWQKEMIPGKGDTKNRAKARAMERWPDETFILPRCRVPHNGVIDAALIAEYARRTRL